MSVWIQWTDILIDKTEIPIQQTANTKHKSLPFICAPLCGYQFQQISSYTFHHRSCYRIILINLLYLINQDSLTSTWELRLSNLTMKPSWMSKHSKKFHKMSHVCWCTCTETISIKFFPRLTQSQMKSFGYDQWNTNSFIWRNIIDWWEFQSVIRN